MCTFIVACFDLIVFIAEMESLCAKTKEKLILSTCCICKILCYWPNFQLLWGLDSLLFCIWYPDEMGHEKTW